MERRKGSLLVTLAAVGLCSVHADEPSTVAPAEVDSAVAASIASAVPAKLAVGFADGLDHKELHTFVGSFLKYAPEDAKLVLMSYSNPPNVSAYDSERVEVVENEKREGWDLANHRYVLYRKYVESLSSVPSIIFNTDVSDVVFQRDPFFDPDENVVHSGREAQYVFANQWNLAWMEKEKTCHADDMKGFKPTGYSISATEVMDALIKYAKENGLSKKDILNPTEKVAFGTQNAERAGVEKVEAKSKGVNAAKLASQSILCSGFSLGHGETMVKYWSAMEKELSSCHHDNSGQDQGAHMYLAYVKQPKGWSIKGMSVDDSSQLATIGSVTLDFNMTECPHKTFRGFCYSADGFVHNKDGEKPAVVHQYNRFSPLTELVQNRVRTETPIDFEVLEAANPFSGVPPSRYSHTELFNGLDRDTLQRWDAGLSVNPKGKPVSKLLA